MTNTTLPPYQAGKGPSTARKLRSRADACRTAADGLRDALAEVELQFVQAFDREDRRRSTQDRLDDLTKRTRQIGA